MNSYSYNNKDNISIDESTIMAYFANYGNCGTYHWFIRDTEKERMLECKKICEKIYPNLKWYIIMVHKNSFTLSFNTENNVGKEYVGGDSFIPYVTSISEANILFQREHEGKTIRSWNIDRFSGQAMVYSNISGENQTSSWNCKKASKKF